MSSENRTSVPNSLNEHWMPFTSNKDFKANPRLITEAKGVYLKTHHGKTQIDASSGLFCNPLGHGRKEITRGISTCSLILPNAAAASISGTETRTISAPLFGEL